MSVLLYGYLARDFDPFASYGQRIRRRIYESNRAILSTHVLHDTLNFER